MKIKPAIAMALLTAGVLCTTPAAQADSTGLTGQVVGIVLNETSGDERGSWYGRIVVRQVDFQLRQYYWGGSLCFTRLVTDRDVEMLSRAVGNRSVEIRPYYKTGSASVRCLVSFTLAEPDVIDALGQYYP